MEAEHIRKLLKRYWSGDSTREEESQLREYFSGDDIASEFENEKSLFNYYSIAGAKKLSSGKSQELLKGLSGKQNGKSVISLTWNALKAAAVITVIFTAGWLVRNEMRDGDLSGSDTFENPEEAYAETKRALQMLSRNLKKGREEASRFKAFSEAEEKAREMLEIKEEENL